MIIFPFSIDAYYDILGKCIVIVTALVYTGVHVHTVHTVHVLEFHAFIL